MVNGKQHSVRFIPTGLKGLAQNVLLNFRLEIPEKFIFIFPGYITNQFNDQLPVGLLAQLVRALHRYRRGQGSNPGKPDLIFSGYLFATA